MSNVNVIELTDQEAAAKRMVEALLFASDRPLSVAEIEDRLPADVNISDALEQVTADYEGRGVELVEIAGKYMFRTASDLSFLLHKEVDEKKKLSRAAVETLAIISYKQPVTRAEIEDIRGVTISKGTMDVLMNADWIKPMGRKRTPGRPMTYGTTENFLVHFGLNAIGDLPGLNELKATGMLDSVDAAFEKYTQESGNLDKDERQIDLEEAIAAHSEKSDADSEQASAEQPTESVDASMKNVTEGEVSAVNSPTQGTLLL